MEHGRQLHAQKSYREGLTINAGQTASGIGGGMCQFTNLLHWLVLHSSLEILEHHHHYGLDLFPDFGKQVPFGVNTSVLYNSLDYRFINKTANTLQLVTWVTDEYLCGELRAQNSLGEKYHIKAEDEFFTLEDGVVYRNKKIYRNCISKHDGTLIKTELLKQNHAKVM